MEGQKVAQESLKWVRERPREIKSALAITIVLKRVPIPLGEKHETAPPPKHMASQQSFEGAPEDTGWVFTNIDCSISPSCR